MHLNELPYKIVLFVTNTENDKIVYEKLRRYFKNCTAVKTLKDLCRHLIDKNTPTVFLMTGDSLEESLINFYRPLDAVKDYEICENKVVALIPLKFEPDAFEAHKCNIIDDYLVARPLYEANRIILIVEHLLYELGIALPSMRTNKLSNLLSSHLSSDFSHLLSKLVDDKNQLETAFSDSVKEIENCLDNANTQIQKNQSVELDLERLQETLNQIKSDQIRPRLLELQQKTLSLLDKGINITPPKQKEEPSTEAKSDEKPMVFNRLYQQDVDINNLPNTDKKKIKILLVEEDIVSRHLNTKLLKSFKSDVDIAASGRNALASMCSVKYDLILMDIILPDTNGIYIVAQTQNEGHLNFKTPIMMMTGAKNKELISEALKNGAKGYVVKPINKKMVSAIFEKYV